MYWVDEYVFEVILLVVSQFSYLNTFVILFGALNLCLSIMYYSFGKERFENRLFGIPLVTRWSSISCGYDDVQKEFLKLINPFLMRTEGVLDEYDKNDGVKKRVSEHDELGDATNSATMGNDADSNSGTEDDIHSSTDFEFYLQGLERAKIIVNKPLPQVTMSSG